MKISKCAVAGIWEKGFTPRHCEKRRKFVASSPSARHCERSAKVQAWQSTFAQAKGIFCRTNFYGLPRRLQWLAMTKIFSVKCAVKSLKFVFVLWLGVGLNLTGCGAVPNANSSKTQTTKAKKLIVKANPANDIVEHLRVLEKYKEIHEITENDMYKVPTDTTFGRKKGTSRSSPNMQALELMFKYRSDIITALREAGYNQAQITNAYQGAFYSYGDTCRQALSGDKYVPLFVMEELPYCEQYKNEFADTIAKCSEAKDYATQQRCGSPYHYTQNEIPKLVAAEYNKPLTTDDFYEAQKRLKKLSDEDLWIPLQRKAKLDEMVENLSSEELAGIVSRLDTAISELRLSGLTQEQASVVLTDVFFRYANECERAQNSTKAVCETYYTEFAHQMMRKDGRRDYLTFARSIIPAKVVSAYTSDIKEDRRKVDEAKHEFEMSSNAELNAGGKSGISWQQVFELIVELAKVASKFI